MLRDHGRLPHGRPRAAYPRDDGSHDVVPPTGKDPIMAKSGGKTNDTAARAASRVLKDGRTSAASKMAAGSALSWIKPKGKSK